MILKISITSSHGPIIKLVPVSKTEYIEVLIIDFPSTFTRLCSTNHNPKSLITSRYSIDVKYFESTPPSSNFDEYSY